MNSIINSHYDIVGLSKFKINIFGTSSVLHITPYNKKQYKTFIDQDTELSNKWKNKRIELQLVYIIIWIYSDLYKKSKVKVGDHREI